MVRWSEGQVVRVFKLFMIARVVQVVQTVPVVSMVQVIRLFRVVQVVRFPFGQVVRLVSMGSLDDILSENIWFACPKSLNN